MIGPRSATYRQASRSSRRRPGPGRSRSATRPDDRGAGHRAIPGEPAVLTGARTLSAGSKVGCPSLQRSAVSRAHSGTATTVGVQDQRTAIGPPRFLVIPYLVSGTEAAAPGDALADNASLRSMPVAADHPRRPPAAGVRVRVPITVPD